MKNIIVGMILGLLIALVVIDLTNPPKSENDPLKSEVIYKIAWIDGCKYAIKNYELITVDSWRDSLNFDFVKFKNYHNEKDSR